MSAPAVEPDIDPTRQVADPVGDQAQSTAGPGATAVPAVATPATFDHLVEAPSARRPQIGGRLDLLNNVEMAVTAELGRTKMTVRNLLSLTPGTVVELDRSTGSPVDLFVNGTLIARGEVVVIDEEFGIRISEIVSAGFEGAAADA